MKKWLVLALGFVVISAGLLFAKEPRVQPYVFTLATYGGGATGSGSPGMLFSLVATAAGPGGAGVIEDSVNGNTAIGWDALYSNTTGGGNTASGTAALWGNTTGHDNTGCGVWALRDNTTGSYNTAIGSYVLRNAMGGSYITAVGYSALGISLGGGHNTAIGYNALGEMVHGTYNTALGSNAGATAHLYNYNIYIGAEVRGDYNDANTIRIGNPYDPTKIAGQNRTFIAGIVETLFTGGDGPSVVGITSDGRLGTIPTESLPQGPQGPIGPQGPAGEGLISGSLLFLLPSATPPAGYNFLGTCDFSLAAPGTKKPTKLTVNVYQKQ